jgi:hypothetical protein
MFDSMKIFFLKICILTFVFLAFVSISQALTPEELQKIRNEIEIIKLTDPELAQAMHQELYWSFRRGEFRMDKELEPQEDEESVQESREEEIERALEEYQDQLSSQRK